MSRIIKNDVRNALTEFYCSLIQLKENHRETIKERDLEREIKQLCNAVKERHRESADKHLIRRALKGEARKLRLIAEQIATGNRVKIDQFIYDLFNGVPVTIEPTANRAYDIVVKLDAGRIKVIVFSPSRRDVGYDKIQAQHQAEYDFELHCTEVEERCQLSESDFKLTTTKSTRYKPATTKKVAGKSAAAKSKTKELPVIGRVLFSRKDQFNLRAEQARDEIKGFVYQEFKETVVPLDILVLEDSEHSTKIYVFVIKIDVNPLSGGGYVSKFSEIATHVVFQPIMEVGSEDGYKGRVRPKDLTNFIIRRPLDQELREVLSIPKSGLPLGWLDYNGTSEVFRYPLIPEDTIYQSIMLAGVQGKGKSNKLKLMIRALSTSPHLPLQKRPAIIILDGEGEYKKFIKKAEMSKESTNFLDAHGIGDVNPQVYTIDDDQAKSNATLSLRGIDRQDLVYLMPELESRTENILQVLINNVATRLDYEKAPQDIHTLRNRLIQENNSSGLVHTQQRPAISRAALSPALNLLDQAGKTPLTAGLLVRPGSVSVIDYQGLDQNKKRVVALYLLLMLSRFKMDEPNHEPGILLVIDEAELLFPANPSKGDKDYVQRIASKMEDITNRGRKRKYGVVLVTHLPSEVSDKVGSLANTKIAFGCSGANNWIRDNFGKEYISEINNLPTGICRIKVKVQNDNQGPINARVRIPFVGPYEDNSIAIRVKGQ